MTLRWFLVALLPFGACAGRGQVAPPRETTFPTLARRCGLTVGGLDSLLTEAASRVRANRGIDIAPDALGAILSTRLPDPPRPADCPAIADTIAHTLMQSDHQGVRLPRHAADRRGALSAARNRSRSPASARRPR